MIDGMKMLITVPEDLDNMRRNENLKFEQRGTCHYAKYRGLHIRWQTSHCLIDGSLHKFKNNGVHNADDFEYSDLKQVIEDLYNELGINPSCAAIKSLEIGINIKLPYNPLMFIDSIVKHGRKLPEVGDTGVKIPYQQYEIKIYSKSQQNQIFRNGNILRFEVKFKKMCKARKELGKVEYLEDLLSPAFWCYSRNYLYKVLNSLSVIDIKSLVYSNIPMGEKLYIHEWKYRDRWANSRVERSRMRAKLKTKLKQYSLMSIHEEVKKLSNCKFESLLSDAHIVSYQQDIRDRMLHFNL
ncbi:hypothetical protein LJC28_01660 [Dysgonomonas sp. OttesenSCG-928-D17]|nr:hypothetical protein [Dysgonomonas sp. OttesenSCG-928-D17]